MTDYLGKKYYGILRKHIARLADDAEADKKYGEIMKLYQHYIEISPSIGGKKNGMCKNFYGSLLCFAFYKVFDGRVSGDEIADLITDMVIGEEKKKKPVKPSKINLNNPVVQKLFYGAMKLYANSNNKKVESGEWGNSWKISVNPKNHKKGVSMNLVGCPIADFARANGFEDIMPVFCASDYEAMSGMGFQLVRENTYFDSGKDCDYWLLNRNDSAEE